MLCLVIFLPEVWAKESGVHGIALSSILPMLSLGLSNFLKRFVVFPPERRAEDFCGPGERCCWRALQGGLPNESSLKTTTSASLLLWLLVLGAIK